MIYNRLARRGERKFARNNNVRNGESCRYVKGSRKISSNPDLAKIAGDGKFGFAMRPPSETKLVKSNDGQAMIKANRYCKKPKHVNHLITRQEMARMGMLSVLTPNELKMRRENERKLRNRIKRMRKSANKE